MSLYPIRRLDRERLSVAGATDGQILSYSEAAREFVLTTPATSQSLSVGSLPYAQAVVDGVTFDNAPVSPVPTCVTSTVGETFVSGGETHAFEGVNPASHTITANGFQVSIRGKKTRIADEAAIQFPNQCQQVESNGIKYVFYSSNAELVMRESTDNLPSQWGSAVLTTGNLDASFIWAAAMVGGRPAVVFADNGGNIRYCRATTATNITAFTASVIVTNEAIVPEPGGIKLQDFAGVPIVHFINQASLLKVRHQSVTPDADGGGTWADGAATLNVGTRTLLTEPLRSTNFYSIGVYGGANTGLLIQDADPTTTRTSGAALFTQPTSLVIALRPDNGLIFLAKENATTNLHYGVTSIENPLTVEITFTFTGGGLYETVARVFGIVVLPTKAIHLFQDASFNVLASSSVSLADMFPGSGSGDARIISPVGENGMTFSNAVKCVDVNNRGLSWNYLANGVLYNEVLTGTLGYVSC